MDQESKFYIRGIQLNFTINFSVISKLIKAVETIYAPASLDNTERRAAQEYCEKVKEEKQAPLIGHFLSHKSNGYNDTLRYYGLGLLENTIRYMWHLYSFDERTQITYAITDLVKNGCRKDEETREKKFFTEKLAHVLAEVAEQEWPQRWPEFNSLMEKLYCDTSYQLFVLNVWKYIAEDTFIFTNPITISRKDDLRNALISVSCRAPASLQEENPFSVSVEIYNAVQVKPGNKGWLSVWVKLLRDHSEGSNLIHSDASESLIYSCINTLAAFLEWLPLEAITENAIIPSLLNSLSHPSSSKIRLAACDALIIAVVRKQSDWHLGLEAIVKPILTDNAFDILARAWQVSGGNSNIKSEDEMENHIDNHYQFIKRLSQLWVDLAADHICNKKADVIVPNFNKYLEFLFILTRNDSLLVNNMALGAWNLLIRHKTTSQSNEIKAYFLPIFELLAQKMNKIYSIPDDDIVRLSNKYSCNDFNEDEAEFHNFFGAFRNQCHQIIRPIVEKFTIETLNSCSLLLTKICSDVGSLNSRNQHRNSLGLLTTKSPYYLDWESIASLIQAIVHALPKSLIDPPFDTELKQAIQTICLKMIQALLEFSCAEPLVVGRVLDCLAVFGPVIPEQNTSLCFSMLQKMFSFVSFTLPNEAKNVTVGWIASEDTKILRRKACISLLKLGSASAGPLGSIYADIYNEVRRLFENELVQFSEKSFLNEFLVSIVFHSDYIDPNSKISLYQNLYSEQLREIPGNLSDMDSFLQQTGLASINSTVKTMKSSGIGDPINQSNLSSDFLLQVQNAEYFRSLLWYSVNTYKSCLSRTVRIGHSTDSEIRHQIIHQSPWASNVSQTMPYFCSLVRHLHSVWNPSLWNVQFASEMNFVLNLCMIDRKIILNHTNFDDDDSTKATDYPKNSLNQYLHDYQGWMRMFRDALYGLLGQVAYLPQFYNIENLADLFINNVFFGIDWMSNHHLKSLNQHVIRPIVSTCPEGCFESLLGRILPPIINFIYSRLDNNWSDLAKKGMLAGTLEQAEAAYYTEADSKEADEVIYQKTLRDLTRSWIDMWSAIFLQTKENKGAKEDKQKIQSASTGQKLKGIPSRQMPEFGPMTRLVEYLIFSDEISKLLVLSFAGSMIWKDTKSCINASRILVRIMPLLAEKEKWHSILCQNILHSALSAIHDGYHQEGHDHIVALITDIYVLLRPKTDMISKAMTSFIPALTDPASFEQFERRIAMENSPSAQRRLVKEVLKDMAGKKPGQWFKKMDHGSQAALRMSIPEKMVGKTLFGSTDLSQNTQGNQLDGQEDIGLDGLFYE